jgi:hypothetical protein
MTNLQTNETSDINVLSDAQLEEVAAAMGGYNPSMSWLTTYLAAQKMSGFLSWLSAAYGGYARH